MAADNIQKLRLYADIWNPQGMTDENSLANALLTQPDVLSPVLTHLAGREDKRFPLSFLTEGLGNIHYINGFEYDYPIMGRQNKAVMCTAVNGGTTAGVSLGAGFANITLTFTEKWFVRQYIIESPDGTQFRIMDDGSETASGGWSYTTKMITTDVTATVSTTDLLNKLFVQLFAPVAASGSRGNESNWVAPSRARNQITQIRKSYRYEGNMPNKVVNVEFNVNGKKTKLWYDFEEYQHMLRWKEEGEYQLWFSKYNRDANGVINLRDENGKPIPLGSGVMEQIPNTDTYTVLTTSKLKNAVRDALFGASDAQAMNIILYTGLGGLEEFDNAIKSEISAGSYIKNTDPGSFITGSGNSMQFGGFFTSYKHIDGHVITVRHLPLLDNGARALNSPKHPRTGLPLESYRMFFLDHSTYDGEPNIQMVVQTGRDMLRWAVAGATVPPGFTGNNTRANDIDGASVHFMKTGGIQIKRATNCLHLRCVAA